MWTYPQEYLTPLKNIFNISSSSRNIPPRIFNSPQEYLMICPHDNIDGINAWQWQSYQSRCGQIYSWHDQAE